MKIMVHAGIRTDAITFTQRRLASISVKWDHAWTKKSVSIVILRESAVGYKTMDTVLMGIIAVTVILSSLLFKSSLKVVIKVMV